MNKATQNYTVRGGGLAISFAVSAHGASLTGVRDIAARKKLLSSSRPLFTLHAKRTAGGEDIYAVSDSGWKNTSAALCGNELILSFYGAEGLERAGVTVKIMPRGDYLAFDTYLENNCGDVSLYECDYPNLCFDVNRNSSFFMPYGSGEVHPVAKKGGWQLTQSYPSYGASMQYLAVFFKASRRGIYYGLHDPAPASKKLCCLTSADGKAFTLKAFQPLSDVKRGSNSQKLCGTLVWRAFDGDWYDAAQLYREFVEKDADYVPKERIDDRKGVPEWAKNVCQWFNTRVTDDAPFADDVIAKARDIGVSSAVHLYYWHQIPFDNDYPHYFPMKSCVPAELKKLHEAGIRVMPYINGRLWDTRDKEDTDFEFTSVAKPYCAKMYNGEPFVETYSSKEKDGSPVRLSVMCPSTTLWQDKVCEIVTKLFDAGFDAVYIDQIAAAEAKPCVDPGHEHPAGGGEWWCRAYNTLLERIERTMPSDRFLTTECTADPFMKHLGGYLTWIWVRNNQVPAFPAVYSDKVIMFGTDYRAFGNFGYGLTGELDEAAVRIFTAQAFLFGQQMGWMLPAVYDSMPYHDYYKFLVRERQTLLGFFNDGRLLRPPVVTSDAPANESHGCREAYGKYVREDAVTAQIWRRNADGARALLAVNAAKCPAHAEFSATCIPDGVYNGITVKNGAFSVEMQPLSLLRIDF